MNALLHERLEDDASGNVRALLRGLEILIAVNEAPPATVSRIVKSTGMPKATVVRLLATLRTSGYLRQDGETQAYHPLPKVRRLASAMMVDNPFMAEARRLLNEFGHVVKWPSEILLADSDAMVILTTNRDTAPITLKRFEQRRFPMLRSAAGIAYLSALRPEEQSEAVTRACSLDAESARGQDLADQTFQLIRIAADKGYSVREYRAPMDGMHVYGVPIRAAGKAVGAFVFVTLVDVVSEGEFAERYLPLLTGKAKQIGEQYVIHGGGAMLGWQD